MARPTQARINLAALRHNVALARALADTSKIMAVVKANAYGHGASIIAQALEADVDALAVACIEEAISLRQTGINCPILLLEGVFTAEEYLLADEFKLWVSIHNAQQLDWLQQSKLTTPIQCWLKIDTGMHRLGVSVDEFQTIYTNLLACKNAADKPVLFTHFACADEAGNTDTAQQISQFEQLTSTLELPRSAANSPGLLAWPQARYDWVRPGYMLYGNSPMLEQQPSAQQLQPVMTLRSEVIALRQVPAAESVGYGKIWTAERPSIIATLPVGYGDGYPRLAPDGTPVLINGQRAALVGRVSMDMITVDVTGLQGVEVGTEAILWGPQLPVTEIASHCHTLGYELLTRMPARTPRIVAPD